MRRICIYLYSLCNQTKTRQLGLHSRFASTSTTTEQLLVMDPVFQALASDGGSAKLTILQKFISHLPHLKDDIILAQDVTHPVDAAPRFLSTSIIDFLSKSCGMTSGEVVKAWEALGPLMWDALELNDQDLRKSFLKHSTEFGFRMRYTYPQACCGDLLIHNKSLSTHSKASFSHLHKSPVPSN